MPVPSSISDLSTTASSNSPAGSETPTEGDNYLRTLSAFIALLRDKLNGTSATGTVKDATISGTATLTADNLKSGTYTPTLTAYTNVGSLTAHPCFYTRIGDVVTVWGRAGFEVTDPSEFMQLDISLPVASAFTLTSDLSGVAACGNALYDYARSAAQVEANVADARASLFSQMPNFENGSQAWSFTFAYRVI